MINRVCLIVNYNLYESKRVFSQGLASALQRLGVEVLIIDVKQEGLNAARIEELKAFDPDLMASFNSFAPDKSGKYIWDYLQIPTLSMLVDPALYAAGISPDPYSLISCVDLDDVESLRQNGYEKVFFLPHATSLDSSPPVDKCYDVVMTGSCYDYESLRSYWQDNLSPEIQRVLEEAIELVLSPGAISLMKALATSWGKSGLNPEGVDFHQLFFFLDNYTRGYDRVELIRSLPDTEVHVFGKLGHYHQTARRGWEYYLRGMPKVTIHPPLLFQDALLMQKQAKICLNSMPFFKNGSHERILTSLAAGAVPITSESLWTKSEFEDGKDLLIYVPGHYEGLEQSIQNLLTHEEQRKVIVERGSQKVAKRHTWDTRAEELVQFIQ